MANFKLRKKVNYYLVIVFKYYLNILDEIKKKRYKYEKLLFYTKIKKTHN